MNHFYKSYKSKKGKVSRKEKSLHEEFTFNYTELPLEEEDTREKVYEQKTSNVPVGLTVTKAVFIIASNVVGAGVITLPYALKQTGWYGVPIIFFTSIFMTCCGIFLSKSWCETLKMSTEIRERTTFRDPYPKLVEFTSGQKIRFLFAILLHMSLMFSCVVTVLLISTNISTLLPITAPGITNIDNLRVWTLLVSLFLLLPFSMMGTPKDYWGVALITFMESLLAGLFIMINIFRLAQNKVSETEWEGPSFESMAHSYGIILYGFSGIAIFPTVQNDLAKPESFYKAIVLGNGIITTMYITIPVASYLMLGQDLLPVIFSTFASSELYKVSGVFKMVSIMAQSLICSHLIGTYIFNINPITLHLEDYIGVPVEFCWQRVVCRSFIVGVITMIALAFPYPNRVLPLTGVLMTSLCVVVPVTCFLKFNDGLPRVPSLFLILVTGLLVLGALLNFAIEIKAMFT